MCSLQNNNDETPLPGERTQLKELLPKTCAFLKTITQHTVRVEKAVRPVTSRQQAFLDFVLAHSIQEGVEDLDQSKLSTLLCLKYGAIPDAIAILGKPDEISSAIRRPI